MVEPDSHAWPKLNFLVHMQNTFFTAHRTDHNMCTVGKTGRLLEMIILPNYTKQNMESRRFCCCCCFFLLYRVDFLRKSSSDKLRVERMHWVCAWIRKEVMTHSNWTHSWKANLARQILSAKGNAIPPVGEGTNRPPSVYWEFSSTFSHWEVVTKPLYLFIL